MKAAPIQPPYALEVNNRSIHFLSPECLQQEYAALDTALASAVWTANLLIFIPLLLVEPTVVSQFFWINGATVAGNTDVGIYSEDGQTKFGSSGSTLNVGASVIQIVDVTNFVIPANVRMWLALGSDSGGAGNQAYLRANLIVGGMDFIGIKQQASGWSSGLPATVTVATPTVAVTPFFGFTSASVI